RVCSGYNKSLFDCSLKCWVMLRCGHVNVQLMEAGFGGAPVTRDGKPASDGLTTAAALATGYFGEALLASVRQSWQQFGHAPVGLVLAGLTTDRGCVCVAVNDTYVGLSGSSREDISGANLLSFFHPEDRAALGLLLGDVLSGAAGPIGAGGRPI